MISECVPETFQLEKLYFDWITEVTDVPTRDAEEIDLVVRGSHKDGGWLITIDLAGRKCVGIYWRLGFHRTAIRVCFITKSRSIRANLLDNHGDMLKRLARKW